MPGGIANVNGNSKVTAIVELIPGSAPAIMPKIMPPDMIAKFVTVKISRKILSRFIGKPYLIIS
ncbi:hypothetical protein FACS189475_03380 [Betaproteobacteria bacterium]|nr:hypothetical protein FACS189475_03380 [Betaproteobacteria bacterium]